ncbi:histidinol-phosphatase [Lachnospiraceae bacterium KM106-2]|nr:histidinol-phosphatase [Lachnospiraceae bacterium KM106-2]
MLANYHTHTYRCYHASGEDREYVEAAIRGGIKELGFSDHCPWIFQNGYVSDMRMAPQEVDLYFTSLKRLKKEYETDITIRIGFEAEYLPELVQKQEQFLKNYPVDYMILGQHFLSPEPNCIYAGAPSKEERYLKQYVDLIIEGMKTGKYLYVAHPDLFHFTGSNEVYELHMTRLCKFLKKNDIPVEINMLGYLDHRQYPSDRFLTIAKKVGNSAIIGVDAHQPERLYDLKAQKACEEIAKKYQLPLVTQLTI